MAEPQTYCCPIAKKCRHCGKTVWRRWETMTLWRRVQFCLECRNSKRLTQRQRRRFWTHRVCGRVCLMCKRGDYETSFATRTYCTRCYHFRPGGRNGGAPSGT